MNRPTPHLPGNYELRIDGHLDQHWSTWLDGLTLTHNHDGTTTLRGPVTDQAELHGLLTKVRDLGATLLSVRAIDADAWPWTRARPQGNPPTPAPPPHPEGPSPWSPSTPPQREASDSSQHRNPPIA
ncbi:MAG: hypothetical protein L0H96_13135 [Humibacillus sp.]|nr:hypothetical protein [Humibacillus sp.]MDN5777844.1 hypothetical protein [Humibacillus sp.]